MIKKQKTKKNIYLVNLGCPKNQVDAETMLGKLLTSNFKLVNSYKQAEIVIINTCGFIDAAKQESTDIILKYAAEWKKDFKDKILIVSGCLVGRYKQKLVKLIPEVDGWITPGEIDKIDKIVDNILQTGEKRILFSNSPKIYIPEEKQKRITKISQPFSAYIKIADGCNNRCSYCVIPDIRGPYVSRSIESIITEAENLANGDIKEINLIAQDITKYGMDIYKKRMLPQLLKKLASIEKLKWIRLLYVYPDKILQEIIEIINSENKICKYIDIPLQHIDEKILRSMHRKSTEKSIRKIIENFKKNIPGIALRTSLIAGFPGETEKQFNKLISWIKETEFDYIGVFAYSKEEGTKAYSLPNHLPQKIKEERQAELLKIQSEIAQKKNMNRVDDIYTILTEKRNGKTLTGRAQFQAPEIDGEIIIENADKIHVKPGNFANVKITNAIEYNLYATYSQIVPSSQDKS